jgi:SepF-like predicted cell division protein (DUF552 family)
MEIKSINDLRLVVSTLPADTKLVLVTVKRRIDDKMHEEIREAVAQLQEETGWFFVLLPDYIQMNAISTETAVTFADKQ